MSALALLLALVGGIALATVARREGRAALAHRAALLDGCRSVFGEVSASLAPDGFPRLAGAIRGVPTRVALIPDVLSLKRLPQLWLALSMPGTGVGPRLVVTARPRGEDPVSDASSLRQSLDVPAWLPSDCAVRGDGEAAGRLLEDLQDILAPAFADDRVKEIAVGPRRLRLVYQAAEGRRGSHLLLRQAHFDTAPDDTTFARLHAILVDVDAVMRSGPRRVAA